MNKIKLKNITNSPNCLKDQIILITGASDGIGRALAIGAAAAGATVILLSKSIKKLEAVYDEIVAAGYPEPAIHPMNLLQIQPDHADEVASSIQSLFGRLDAVVHNAGISGQITPLDHLSPQNWQQVIHLNLNVPFLLTHSLLPLLRQSKNASLLFTAADEALSGKAYWAAYSASKFGVVGLAQSLHEELHTNTHVRVNCINPGKVRTSLRTKVYPGVDPLTFPSPEEIVPFYLHLLSPDAKAVRGQWIDVELPKTIRLTPVVG